MYGIDGHPYSYFAMTCCQIRIATQRAATATAAIAHEIKQPPLANFALQKTTGPFDQQSSRATMSDMLIALSS